MAKTTLTLSQEHNGAENKALCSALSIALVKLIKLLETGVGFEDQELMENMKKMASTLSVIVFSNPIADYRDDEELKRQLKDKLDEVGTLMERFNGQNYGDAVLTQCRSALGRLRIHLAVAQETDFLTEGDNASIQSKFQKLKEEVGRLKSENERLQKENDRLKQGRDKIAIAVRGILKG